MARKSSRAEIIGRATVTTGSPGRSAIAQIALKLEQGLRRMRNAADYDIDKAFISAQKVRGCSAAVAEILSLCEEGCTKSLPESQD